MTRTPRPDRTERRQSIGSSSWILAESAGEIGWTHLRLLCRVATVEDQQEWIALASRLSTRALAREVRAVDRVARNALSMDSQSDDEERVGVVLRLSSRARARWWSARQFASRIAGHALSHGAFAEVLAAEVLSGVPLETSVDPEVEAASACKARGVPEGRVRRAAPGVADLGSPDPC